MNCSDAMQYMENGLLSFSLSMEAVLAVGGIITSIAFLSRHINHVFFHPNYRVLLKIYLCTFIVRSAVLAAIQGYHIFSYLMLDPCDIYVSSLTCFLFRHASGAITTVMIFTEFAIVVERYFALYYGGRYDFFGNRLGIVLGTLAITIGEGWNLYLQSNFPRAGDKFALCTGAIYYKKFWGVDGYDIWLYVNMAVEITSLLAVLRLYFLCKNRNQRVVYDLCEKFERQRNVKVLTSLIPVMGFHSVWMIQVMGCQALLNYLQHFKRFDQIEFKAWTTMANTLTVFTFLAPLLMSLLHNRQKKQVKLDTTDVIEQADTHYAQYEKLWS